MPNSPASELPLQDCGHAPHDTVNDLQFGVSDIQKHFLPDMLHHAIDKICERDAFASENGALGTPIALNLASFDQALGFQTIYEPAQRSCLDLQLFRPALSDCYERSVAVRVPPRA
jgi:hypothetical protein